MPSEIEERLKEMNIELPNLPEPKFAYVSTKKVNNLVYTSGFDCRKHGELQYKGKLGKDLTIEEGYEAARLTMLNCLAAIRDEIGHLGKVKQVVKVLGFVNSAPGFVEQPLVINGASDLLHEIFGERGKHARSAISANELPFDTPVEIEMIVEVDRE